MRRIGLGTLVLMIVSGLATGIAAEVREVRMDAEPAYRRELAARELWRSGIDPDDPVIGLVGGAHADGEGNIHILDIQLQRVISFTRGGTCLGVTCQRGEGPGEVENIYHLTAVDGNPGLVDLHPPMIRTVDSRGHPLETIHLADETGTKNPGLLVNASVGADRLLAITSTRSIGSDGPEEIMTLALHRRDGRRIRSLATEHIPGDLAERGIVDERSSFVPFLEAFCMLPGDLAAYVPLRDTYRIDLCDADGETVFRLLNPHHVSHQRSAAERREVADNISVVVGRREIEVEKRVCDTDPVLIGLMARGTRLWASTMRGYRNLDRGQAVIYDEIDPGTGLYGEVVVTLPSGTGRDMLVWASDTLFLKVLEANSRTPGESGAKVEGTYVIAYEVIGSDG